MDLNWTLVNQSVCWQRVGGKSLYLSLNNSVSFINKVPRNVYRYSFNLARSCRLHFLRKVRGKIYSINCLKTPLAVRKLLYQVYLLPILEYCDVVWQPTNTNQTRHLERSYISLCTDASISSQSLVERRKFHTILQPTKYCSNLPPWHSYLNMLSMLQDV